MSPSVYNGWVNGGKVMQGMQPTNSPSTFLVSGSNSTLQNITLRPQEAGIINLKFNFLTGAVSEKEEFTYHVVLRDNVTNKVIGGETYLIRKKPRNPFYAEIGTTTWNNQTVLAAKDINEDAEYNWYNKQGDLVSSGREMVVSSNQKGDYTLEVIAKKDGYKDYSTIKTESVEKIESISPNPTTGETVVRFTLLEPRNVRVVVSETGSSKQHIYPVADDRNEVAIDTSEFVFGVYTVTLISNEKIVDTQKLIKQ